LINHIKIVIDVYEGEDSSTSTGRIYINDCESELLYNGITCDYSISRGYETKHGDVISDGKMYLDVSFKGIHEDSN